jgi:urease accessory protein
MESFDGLSLLHLLQLGDTAFPIGGFAHSTGIESLCQDGALFDGRSPLETEDAVTRLLQARLAIELAHADLPLLLRAHALAIRGAIEAIVELDSVAQSVRPVWEWREAGARMGRRMIDAVAEFAPTPLIAGLARERQRGPQLPIAFGVAAQQLGCADEPAAQAFAANYCSAQLNACVRLGLLGQRSVLRIVHGLKPDIVAAVEGATHVAIEKIGGSMPLLEIAGMRHQYAHERLFTS